MNDSAEYIIVRSGRLAFQYTEAIRKKGKDVMVLEYKSENQKNALQGDVYHCVIDSQLRERSLTYGEVLLKVIRRRKFRCLHIFGIRLWRTMRYQVQL